MIKSIKRKTIVVLFVSLLAAVCTLCLSGCNEKSDYEQFELSNFVGNYINVSETPYAYNRVKFEMAVWTDCELANINAYVVKSNDVWTLDFVNADTGEKLSENRINKDAVDKVKYFASLLGGTCSVENDKIIFGEKELRIDKTWYLEREVDDSGISVRKVLAVDDETDEKIKLKFYRGINRDTNVYYEIIRFVVSTDMRDLGSTYNINVEAQYLQKERYEELESRGASRILPIELPSLYGQKYVGFQTRNYYIMPGSEAEFEFYSWGCGRFNVQLDNENIEVYIDDQKLTAENGNYHFEYLDNGRKITLKNNSSERQFGQIKIDCSDELVGEHTLAAGKSYLYKLTAEDGLHSFSTQNGEVVYNETYTLDDRYVKRETNVDYDSDFVVNMTESAMYVNVENKSKIDQTINVVEKEIISVTDGEILTIPANTCGGVLRYKGSAAGDYVFQLKSLDSQNSFVALFYDDDINRKVHTPVYAGESGTYRVMLKENESVYIIYDIWFPLEKVSKVQFSAEYEGQTKWVVDGNEIDGDCIDVKRGDTVVIAIKALDGYLYYLPTGYVESDLMSVGVRDGRMRIFHNSELGSFDYSVTIETTTDKDGNTIPKRKYTIRINIVE